MKNTVIILVVVISVLLAACAGGGPSPTPTLDPVVAKGQSLFRTNCASCHALIPETIVVGPSLYGIASRAGDQMDGLDAKMYIELSILKPDAYIVEGFDNLMPSTFGKTLTTEELNALVAFLLTNKED